jgi:hypothetical protein
MSFFLLNLFYVQRPIFCPLISGVIYCKPHHKELFQPKPVIKDLTEEIINKNIDFSTMDPIGKFSLLKEHVLK